jgi:hypothetical protein
MIDTYDGKFINTDALKEWLDKSLKNFLPEDTHISIVPYTWDAKGESRFFCEIDIENDVSISQLLSKVVIEHSRGPYIHFYAKDVVEAAVTAKVLEGDHFYLYYKW